MTRKKSPTTNAEALDQAQASAARVASTIASVLRKFPRETLAPRLLPFVQHRSRTAVRRSSDGRELVMSISTVFSEKDTARFPVALLDAPESDITKWAREQYWSEIHAARYRERQDAQAKLTRAKNTVTQAQRDLEKAQEQLTRATAVVTRKTSIRQEKRVGACAGEA